MRRYFQISIDGPVGAGKSTVAQRLSERIGFLYVDTGAMYRAVAFAAKKEGVNWVDEQTVSRLVKNLEIELKRPVGKKKDGRKVSVCLNGEDVSWKIREEEFGEGASVVGQYQEVRRELVRRQRKMSRCNNVVMEGRDIGTRVLPNADLKIYMDADLKERVRRKGEQLRSSGQQLSVKQVRQDIVTRDNREMTRAVDPLRPAHDAWMLDTTKFSVEEVVNIIVQRIASIQGET